MITYACSVPVTTDAVGGWIPRTFS